MITIDFGKRYQKMVAWEATAQLGQEFPSFPRFRDQLLAESVNDLGINRMRLEVRSGVENASISDDPTLQSQRKAMRYEIVNDNDDPFEINEAAFHFAELDRIVEQALIPMRKLASDRGESFLVNLNYVDFGSSAFEHKDHPEEYAEFILAVFQHMRDKFGFVPDTVEVILEPDTDDASWSSRQIADAIVATSKRLRANGFAPGFVTPSTTDASNAVKFIDEIAAVPGAMEEVVELSYHRYSGVSDDVLRSVGERAARYSKRTSMLEWIGADYKALHKDLKLANVSAWAQYTLAYAGDDDGGAYYKIRSEDSGGIRMGRRTRFLRQYFNCIRPGSIRIGADSSNSNFDPVAFERDGKTASVVIKSDNPGKFSVRGLSSGTYSISYTTEDSDTPARPEERVVDDGTELTATIPSPGVLTVCRVQ